MLSRKQRLYFLLSIFLLVLVCGLTSGSPAVAATDPYSCSWLPEGTYGKQQSTGNWFVCDANKRWISVHNLDCHGYEEGVIAVGNDGSTYACFDLGEGTLQENLSPYMLSINPSAAYTTKWWTQQYANPDADIYVIWTNDNYLEIHFTDYCTEFGTVLVGSEFIWTGENSDLCTGLLFSWINMYYPNGVPNSITITWGGAFDNPVTHTETFNNPHPNHTPTNPSRDVILDLRS